MSKLRINKMHFIPECCYRLIFAGLRGLFSLNPHQSCAFEGPPRPSAETDIPKFLLDATLGASKLCTKIYPKSAPMPPVSRICLIYIKFSIDMFCDICIQ